MDIEHLIVRPLGGLERAFFSHSLQAPIDFSVVAEVTGVIDKNAVSDGIFSLWERHPSLRVEVIDHPSQGLSFAWSDRKPDLVITQADDAAKWTDTVLADLQRWEDVRSTPLMRASVSIHPESFSISFTFNHSIIDGRGAIAVLHDFIRIIAGERLSPLIGLPGFDEFAVRFGSNSIRLAPPEGANPDIRIRQITDDPLHLSILEFDPDLTARLTAKCRSEAATVHGAICAAAALATTSDRTRALGVSSPVDLRPTAGREAECPGLFMGLSGVFLEVNSGERLWPIARRSTDGIAAVKTPETAVEIARVLGSVVPKTADPTAAFAILSPQVLDLMISNLGRLSIPTRIGRFKIDSIWGPILNTQVAKSDMIGVSTFGDTLRLAHVHTGDKANLLGKLRAVIEEAL